MKYSFLSLILSIVSIGSAFAQLPDHRKEHQKNHGHHEERKHKVHAPEATPNIAGWVHIHELDTENIFYIRPTEVTLLEWTYFILDKYAVEKNNSATYKLALPERNPINELNFYSINELQALWADSLNALKLTPADVKDILTKKGVANLPVTGITMEAAKEYMEYLTITYKGTAANGIHNDFDKTLKVQDFIMTITLPTTTEYRILLANYNQPNTDTATYRANISRGYGDNFCPLFNANFGADVMKSACPDVQDSSPLVSRFGHHGKAVFPAGTFPADPYGLFDLRGNVSEMTTNEGVAMGGSYRTPPSSCSSESAQAYTRTATWLGFRPIMLLKKK
jgi:hypothetical protein